MNLFHVIVLGLIQGFTEFLPISSSGHLLLFEKLFGLSDNLLVFDIFLHLGTLIAVCFCYRKELLYLLKHPFCDKAKKLYLASGVTVVLVIIFKKFLLNSFSATILPFCFLITALLLVLASNAIKKSHTKKISYLSSVVIGIAQGIACLPGISRSGATLSTSLLLKNEKNESLSFSFLLSIPIILASLVFSVFEVGVQGVNVYLAIIGIVVSFLSGLLSIKFLKVVIEKKSLVYFALYLVVLALVLFLIF